MDLTTALYVLALILAILAAIPPLRTFYLLNLAVVALALGLVINSGAIKV
jgi:flagellar biosynthesis component FlhA